MSKRSINILICAAALVLLAVLLCIYLLPQSDAGQRQFTGNSLEVNAADEICINTETVFEFVYKYSDGIDEVYYSLPASYMSGWNRQRIADAYTKWTIDSFGGDRVVLHKYVEGDSNQHYILKDNDGYVTVFYSNSGDIKEVTSANVSSLTDEERKMYTDGVEVVGSENLQRYLQDLES